MTEGLEEFQTKWWNEGLSKQLPQTQGSLTDEMCKNWQGPRIDEWSPGRTRAKYENNDDQTWIEVVGYRDCAPKYVSEFLLNFSGSCARKPICPTAWQRRISSSETTSRTVPATKRPVALADPRRRWEVRPGGIFLPRNNTRNHAYCFTNKNLPAFTESEPKTPCQTQTMLIGFRFCFLVWGSWDHLAMATGFQMPRFRNLFSHSMQQEQGSWVETALGWMQMKLENSILPPGLVSRI